MKKTDFATLIVYVFLFIIAIFAGTMVIGPSLDKLDLTTSSSRYLFAILSILLGLIFNILLIEIGHIIGAKLGGYKIISVNILGLCLYKQAGKWRFTFRGFDGFTGETRIVAKNEKASPKLYSWLPLFLYALEATVLILAYSIIKDPVEGQVELSAYIKYASLIFITIGGMLMFYNIMPFQMDTMNDGYRLVLVNKPVNVQAFNALSVIEEKIINQEENDEITTFQEITILTSRVNLYAIQQKIYREKFAEAEVLIDQIIANKERVSIEDLSRAAAQKIYLLLKRGDQEEAENYFLNAINKDVRKYIGNDLSLPTLRAYFLYSGLVSKSVSECGFVLGRIKKATNREQSQVVKEKEEVLFADALNQVKEANPTWEFAIPEE